MITITNKPYTKIKTIIITIMLLFLGISIFSISSTCNFPSGNQIIIKQIMWYVIGFIIIFISAKINLNFLIKYSVYFYIVGNILLLLLLFFGKEINGAKCWFLIPGIGTFQPSEFMKLFLILLNAKIIIEFQNNNKTKKSKDIILFLIILFLTAIPSFLTFLEPDTGMVIIYFIISMVMLFISGIKKRIFVYFAIIIILLLGAFFYLYFNFENLFIDLFGTSFFYRIDRLLDWSNKDGMQLTNALTAIKAAGIYGFGFKKTPIYIPEAHTDFIFSVYASNTGFLGAIFLISIIIIFNFTIFLLINKSTCRKYKLIAFGFLAVLIYQQIQNIGMNIGLLPITGITLPFISYGGSSTLSYMLGIAFILNYKKNLH